MWSDRFSNFNPRTPYGMRRRLEAYNDDVLMNISIHAPLTGCDINKIDYYDSNQKTISIHAPLTGCDVKNYLLCEWGTIFQSTHPLRDATIVKDWTQQRSKNFNPRTPYGMRQEQIEQIKKSIIISIHAPLTGCDTIAWQ